MTKHIITQYDRDAREWIEVLPKDEKKAMKYVLSKINRKPTGEKDVKHIEKSALKRLEVAAEKAITEDQDAFLSWLIALVVQFKVELDVVGNRVTLTRKRGPRTLWRTQFSLTIGRKLAPKIVAAVESYFMESSPYKVVGKRWTAEGKKLRDLFWSLKLRNLTLDQIGKKYAPIRPVIALMKDVGAYSVKPKASSETPLKSLKSKYPLKALPKYYDAPYIKRYSYTPQPGGKVAFTVEIDGEAKSYVATVGNGPRKQFNNPSDMAKYVLDTMAKQKPAGKIVPASDVKIFKFLGDRLDKTFNSKNVGFITYIKWPTSIEITSPANAYTQFKEGDPNVHFGDDTSYLSEIGMSLEDFEAWLIKKGAEKVSKPKRTPYTTMYD